MRGVEALIEQYPSLARRRDYCPAASRPCSTRCWSITTLTTQGIGILMVEQNIREAMPIADRLYILAAGEKRFEGSPRDVRDDRQIMDIYMGGA